MVFSVRRLVYALVVWLVVAIILELVGDLLGGNIGAWLASNNVLLGFLAGVLTYFSGWGAETRV